MFKTIIETLKWSIMTKVLSYTKQTSRQYFNEPINNRLTNVFTIAMVIKR